MFFGIDHILNVGGFSIQNKNFKSRYWVICYVYITASNNHYFPDFSPYKFFDDMMILFYVVLPSIVARDGKNTFFSFPFIDTGSKIKTKQRQHQYHQTPRRRQSSRRLMVFASPRKYLWAVMLRRVIAKNVKYFQLLITHLF